MNNEEDGWFDASEDPDCPFIEHSDQKAQGHRKPERLLGGLYTKYGCRRMDN